MTLRISTPKKSLEDLNARVIACRRCPRLVRWREKSAREKTARFAGEEYWGKPLPGFGDPRARVLLVGLAPAANGGNRTGRMFTGDRSGDWLFRALYRAGFASSEHSLRRDDGLTLTDCYITASLRCAPPLNKPMPGELNACNLFFREEIELLTRVKVVVGLGKIGWETALKTFRDMSRVEYARRPQFGHGVVVPLGDLTFVGTYHPSQQNTFTGKLTEEMLDAVFSTVRSLIRA